MFGWWTRYRRRRIWKQPWPAAWTAILERNVGLFHGLSMNERFKLRRIVQILVTEKHWEGHSELDVDDEVRVTIAGTAGLMLLGVDDFYFDNVRTIILFPHPVKRKAQRGMLVDEETHHAGEAWQGGPIVLSWSDALWNARHPGNGHNLVIHEFSHALDGLDGEMGGNPVFPESALAERWETVCEREYRQLVRAAREGTETLLDPYGASNRAEFFAVVSETFFELPHDLRRWHPELFELLQAYYRLDPRRWYVDPFPTSTGAVP